VEVFGSKELKSSHEPAIVGLDAFFVCL